MLTPDRIGDVAGVVWERLRKNEGKGCTVTELKKIRGCTGDEVLAALGWLAREGKLCIESQGRKTVFTLVEEELEEVL
jgi:hypothetical protein